MRVPTTIMVALCQLLIGAMSQDSPCDCDKLEKDIVELQKANDDIRMNLNILTSELQSTRTLLQEQIKNSTEKNSQQDSSIGENKYNLSRTREELQTFKQVTTATLDQMQQEIWSNEKSLPVGSILPLWKEPDMNFWKENWIPCNGQLIVDGPLKNLHAPDLNNARRFIRGGPKEAAGSYQDQDTNMNKLGGKYLDRFYWEGRSTCDEGTVEGHYDEDGGYPDRNFNTRCRVTRDVQFSNKEGETRPDNMAVLYYIKLQ